MRRRVTPDEVVVTGKGKHNAKKDLLSIGADQLNRLFVDRLRQTRQAGPAKLSDPLSPVRILSRNCW